MRLSCLLLAMGPLNLSAEEKATADLEDAALAAMKKATSYMMDSVSCHGGFVWNYTLDRSRRWGEMEAYPTMIWMQSPGTPQMGHTLLDAYHATGDEFFYEAARKVGQAVIDAQLPAGGWNYMFDYAGENSMRQWYATIGKNGWRLEEFHHYYGNATFDDGVTVGAATYLLRLYKEKEDAQVKEALDKAISMILESQYPCGGWPQRYPLMYDHPFRGKADYSSFVTLNDGVTQDLTSFLLECMFVLGREDLREPILRSMYVILDLQQPLPYAGWNDQYTVGDLKPAHGRSYEPRCIKTSSTQSMIQLCMRYYLMTGDSRFLERLPEAIDFLAHLTPEGYSDKPVETDVAFVRIPRFIDVETGKPMFLHRVGSNVQNGHYYTDENPQSLVGHYGSFATVNVASLRQQLETVRHQEITGLGQPHELRKYYSMRSGRPNSPSGGASGENAVESAISSLSPEGCWVGRLSNDTHIYEAYCDTVPSTETAYASSNVGDEHDTSPYPSPVRQTGINIRDYMSRMSVLSAYVAACRGNL